MDPAKALDHYRLGRWKTFVQFKCNYCAFDTLDSGSIAEHVYERHILPEAQTKALQVPLFDGKGNLITHLAS